MSVSDSLEADTNDMMFQIGRSGKSKANGKIQDDKEVTKRKRRNVQPAVINNDGICFPKMGNIAWI